MACSTRQEMHGAYLEWRHRMIVMVCERNDMRKMWVKQYPKNSRLARGWLSRKAKTELEAAGNRLTYEDGHWIMNKTGQQHLGRGY